MGRTKVTVKLTNPAAPNRSYEALFLVDTGATDCLAPAEDLQKIGIPEEGDPAQVTLGSSRWMDFDGKSITLQRHLPRVASASRGSELIPSQDHVPTEGTLQTRETRMLPGRGKCRCSNKCAITQTFAPELAVDYSGKGKSNLVRYVCATLSTYFVTFPPPSDTSPSQCRAYPRPCRT